MQRMSENNEIKDKTAIKIRQDYQRGLILKEEAVKMLVPYIMAEKMLDALVKIPPEHPAEQVPVNRGRIKKPAQSNPR